MSLSNLAVQNPQIQMIPECQKLWANKYLYVKFPNSKVLLSQVCMPNMSQ